MIYFQGMLLPNTLCPFLFCLCPRCSRRSKSTPYLNDPSYYDHDYPSDYHYPNDYDRDYDEYYGYGGNHRRLSRRPPSRYYDDEEKEEEEVEEYNERVRYSPEEQELYQPKDPYYGEYYCDLPLRHQQHYYREYSDEEDDYDGSGYYGNQYHPYNR